MKEKLKTKIVRQSMRDEAYSILQELIINGDLKPEQKLKDAEVSEMLGISRTPVREALLRLEDEGLIQSKANRWTMVASIDLKKTTEIYTIVNELEKLAVTLAIKNINEKHIKELKRINELFKKQLLNGENKEAFESDFQFHDTIIKLSENSELQSILSGLKLKIKRIEIHYFDKVEKTTDSYTEHTEIIKALKTKDLNKAIEHINKNWNQSLTRIIKTVKENESY